MYLGYKFVYWCTYNNVFTVHDSLSWLLCFLSDKKRVEKFQGQGKGRHIIRLTFKLPTHNERERIRKGEYKTKILKTHFLYKIIFEFGRRMSELLMRAGGGGVYNVGRAVGHSFTGFILHIKTSCDMPNLLFRFMEVFEIKPARNALSWKISRAYHFTRLMRTIYRARSVKNVVFTFEQKREEVKEFTKRLSNLYSITVSQFRLNFVKLLSFDASETSVLFTLLFQTKDNIQFTCVCNDCDRDPEMKFCRRLGTFLFLGK